MNNEIPHIIHYCWFGKKPLPELALKCIESWKKFLPDYEIKRWDESNFDINVCLYTKEAYKAKKYAFVSDYARFKILYEYGGLYFDTDVEIIKPLADILSKGGFMGVEKDEDNICVAPGLGLAINSESKLYKEILDGYHKRRFIKQDGSFDLTTVVKYVTEILKKYGLKNKDGIQRIADIYIYPKEYFCPMDYNTGAINITESTVSIHHFSASWHTSMEKLIHTLERKSNKSGMIIKSFLKLIIFFLRVWNKLSKKFLL